MPRRVLLIEDEPEFQLLVRVALEGAGYTVDAAADGEAGLTQALAGDYDLILLDLMPPKMHGYEVIQRLRADAVTRQTPIIVISAKTFASDQRKAMEMGADAFLGKPFDFDELLEVVGQLSWQTRVTFWGVRGSIAAPGPETVRYGGNT